MSFWDKNVLLKSLEKNKQQRINISYVENKEKELKGVDIRTFYQEYDKETKEFKDNWLPSSKGIFIPIEFLDDISKTLNKLSKKLK